MGDVVVNRAVPNLLRYAQTQVVEARQGATGGGRAAARISERQRILDRKNWSSKRLLQRFTPVLALRSVRIRVVACAYHHTLMLDSAGRVLAVGLGVDGQLGVGTTESAHEPVVLETLNPKAMDGDFVVALAGGKRFSMAATREGRLYTWGTGEHGELGQGPARLKCTKPEPVFVDGQDRLGVVLLAAGANHALAATRREVGDEKQQEQEQQEQQQRRRRQQRQQVRVVLAWGRNECGQLGTGDRISRFEPAKVNATGLWWQADVLQLAAGQRHSAAVTAAGDLWTWGRGRQGQLCHARGERDAERAGSTVPRHVEGLQNHTVVQAACGAQHTAVLTEDRRVFLFGGEAHVRARRDNNAAYPLDVARLPRLADKTVIQIASGGPSLFLVTQCKRAFMMACEERASASDKLPGPLYAPPKGRPGVSPATPCGDQEGQLLVASELRETAEEVAYLDYLLDDMLLKTDNDGVDVLKNTKLQWAVGALVSTTPAAELLDALGFPVETRLYSGKTPFYIPGTVPERAEEPSEVAKRTRTYYESFEKQYNERARADAVATRPVLQRRPTVSAFFKSTGAKIARTNTERRRERAATQAGRWRDLLQEHGWSEEIRFGNFIPLKLVYDLQAYGRRLEDDNIMLELRRVFYFFDTDESGEIDALEMRAALRKLGMRVSRRKARRIVQQYDKDRNGTIGEEEFLNFCFEQLLKARSTNKLVSLFAGGSIISKMDPPPAAPPETTPAQLRREEKEFRIRWQYRKLRKAVPRVFPDTFMRFVRAFMQACVELGIWGSLPARLKRQTTVPTSQPLFHVGVMDLTDCEMTDDAVRALCIALKCAPVVRRLDLRRNKITGLGASALVELLDVQDYLADFVDCAQCMVCYKVLGFDDPSDPRTPGVSCECSPASRGGYMYYLPVYWLEHVVAEDPQSNEQKLASCKLALALELDACAERLLDLEKPLSTYLPEGVNLPALAERDMPEEGDTYPFDEETFRRWLTRRVREASEDFFTMCTKEMEDDIKLREVRRVFLEHDKDESGHLDVKELSKCLKQLGLGRRIMSSALAKATLEEIDSDGNGFVTIDEFEQFVMRIMSEGNMELKLLGKHRRATKLDIHGRKTTTRQTTMADLRAPSRFIRRQATKRKVDEAEEKRRALVALAARLSQFGLDLCHDFHRAQYRTFAHDKLRNETRSRKIAMYESMRGEYHRGVPFRRDKDIQDMAYSLREKHRAELEDTFGWTVQPEAWDECIESIEEFGELLAAYYSSLNAQVCIERISGGAAHAVLLTSRRIPWACGFQDDGKGDTLALWSNRVIDGVRSIETIAAIVPRGMRSASLRDIAASTSSRSLLGDPAVGTQPKSANNVVPAARCSAKAAMAEEEKAEEDDNCGEAEAEAEEEVQPLPARTRASRPTLKRKATLFLPQIP